MPVIDVQVHPFDRNHPGRPWASPSHGLDSATGEEMAALELAYNWDPEPYTGGRNFGHLAYAVDNIYDTCSAFIARGVTINRPPHDGRMAFVRTPDGIFIELLQAGAQRCRLPNPGPA